MGAYWRRIRVLSSGESVPMSMIFGDAGGDGDGDGDHVLLGEANLGDSGSMRDILLECSEMDRSQSLSEALGASSFAFPALSRRPFQAFGSAGALPVLLLTPPTGVWPPPRDQLRLDKVAADDSTSLRPTSPRSSQGEHVLQKRIRSQSTLT